MIKRLLITCLLLLLPAGSHAQSIIPGLTGFGTDTRGAYGSPVTTTTPWICVVDDLTATEVAENVSEPTWDAATYSVGVFKGTLRQCLEGIDTRAGNADCDGQTIAANSGKIVLFETSGTISQTGDNTDASDFRYELYSYTSIYGQTAPEPGILLRNIQFFGDDTSNVVIQHVRFRMDGPPSLSYGVHKSLLFNPDTGETTENIILDHISAAWGEDTQASLFDANNPGTKFGDFTISNSIFGPSRENQGLDGQQSNQSKNFAVGRATDAFIYGNLFYAARWRNPKLDNANALVANNYSYNNLEFGYGIDGNEDAVSAAFVNNVLDGGPLSGGNASHHFAYFFTGGWDEPLSQHEIYLYGNRTDNDTDTGYWDQTNSEDWNAPNFQQWIPTAQNIYTDMVDPGTDKNIQTVGETPSTDSSIWVTGFTPLATTAVKQYIIDYAGAYPAYRDSIDSATITALSTGGGPSSLYDGAPSAGDWPTLAVSAPTLAIPSSPHTVPVSTYTNLELWIHQLAYAAEGIEISSANPPDNGTGFAVSGAITWSNPNVALVDTIDIRFGSCPSPSVVSSSAANTVETYDPPGDLTVGTEYCWGVDINHVGGETITGTIFSLTTTDGPPIPEGRKPTLKYSPYAGSLKYSSYAGSIKR